MPPVLPIDLANFPSLRTRKALLIVDLQNEFLSPRAGLPVRSPEGFVDRTLDLARAFRDSGSGDVFWVRSQFDAHRPAASAQIIATDASQPPGSPAAADSSSRSHRRTPDATREDLDADPEAFLSIGEASPETKIHASLSLLPGSFGSELTESVVTSISARKDLVFAKTHYSAFQSTQLLQRLRTRFVTELYICGALTNISIYATALDAASHGLALTIVEDCCGYRTAARHDEALLKLVRLTGCDIVKSPEIAASLATDSAPDTASNPLAAAMAAIATANSNGLGRPPRRSTKQAGPGPIAVSPAVAVSEASESLPVRTKVPELDKPAQEEKEKAHTKKEHDGDGQIHSTSTSSTSAQLELSRSPPTANPVVAEDQSQKTQSLQPVVVAAGPTGSTNQPTNRTTPTDDPTFIEADPIFQPGKADAVAPAATDAAAAGGDSGFHPGHASREGKPPEASARDVEPTPDDIRRAIQDARRASQIAREKYLKSQKQATNQSPSEDVSSTLTVSAATKTATAAVSVATSTATGPCSTQTATPKAEMGAASQPVPETRSPPGDPGEASKNVSSPEVSPTAQAESHRDGGSDLEADTDSDTPLAEVDTTKQPAPTEPLCEGDTIVYHNVLPTAIEKGIYERLHDEVHWLRMAHQGGEVPRLVCVQGEVDEKGNMPIYRHPADESPPLEPFSPTVLQIKAEVEKIAGHPLNHALIQLYRTGNDYISEHSDKTLDIVQGSFVCNMSLGAERMMVFRTKRPDKDPSRSTEAKAGNVQEHNDQTPDETEKQAVKKRQTCRVQLPHNSLCRMGLQTNMRWLHAIRQDKRAERDKTSAELAFDGGRISLTFRQIGTFLDRDQTVIWGQGAVAKLRKDAQPVINGQSEDAIRMLRAFGLENHSSNFDWKKHYGEGFDVLHMSSSPRFFASVDPVVNLSIQLLLADLGIAYAKGSINKTAGKGGDKATDNTGSASLSSLDIPVRYIDNDSDRSVADGLLAILLYLNAVHRGPCPSKQTPTQLEVAHSFTRLQQALGLQDKWRGVQETATDSKATFKSLKEELATWNSYATAKTDSASFIAGGPSVSLADFAFWPVLHELGQSIGSEADLAKELTDVGYEALAQYYAAFKAKKSVQRVFLSSSGSTN